MSCCRCFKCAQPSLSYQDQPATSNRLYLPLKLLYEHDRFLPDVTTFRVIQRGTDHTYLDTYVVLSRVHIKRVEEEKSYMRL